MIGYLSIEQVLALHAYQTKRYGGRAGRRDRAALKAAVARPQATFGGEDLYPEAVDKAAALMHSLVSNHPFVDGNKRVGSFAALVFLRMNGFDALCTPGELTSVTMAVARGEIAAEAVSIWFKQRVRER